MRLIDADALMEELYDNLCNGEVLYRISPSDIDNAPTVDAVPIVRCKDCKHAKKSSYVTERYGVPGVKTCKRLRRCVAPDDFCWLGEPKDGDE